MDRQRGQGGDDSHRSFFFSSRGRHTRLTCDWSSDVCSSDLEPQRPDAVVGAGRADDGVWTLRLTPTHGYVLCPFSRVGALRERIGDPALDVSSAYAGVALGGVRRRDVFSRSSGLDVRESRFGAGRCMAGSVMRVPTLVLNRGDDLVMLVAWEYGEYFWEAILDAGEMIGIARTSVVAA